MASRFGLSVPVSLVMVSVFIAGLPVHATAGVYDDVAAWWQFDYDPNTNGLADTDEIRDQRDWGTAATKGAGGRHAQLSAGPLGTPAWTNEVFSPAGGNTYGRLSMAFNPITNATSCWPDTFKLTNFVITGSATIVTRFRWDGYAFNSSNPGWLYNNGLFWANAGWMFGIQNSTLSVISGWAQSSTFFSETIITGKWYEAAAVLTDNGAADTVEFYLMQDGGAIKYSKTTTLSLTNIASLSTGTIIGAEAASSGYATGNALKAFKGAVNHIAVWNRALSSGEVHEAFCYPQPLIQIGLNNNSPADLRQESEVDAEYLPGDPWNTMRRAVTPTLKDATLKMPLTSIQAGLNYVFHLKTLPEPGKTGDLSLIVNDTTNTALTASANKDLYWYIKANTLRTGTNTFTIHYDYKSGDASYVAFDWMELGGAWQIGADNNSQAEFRQEGLVPDDFYVTDPNWMHLERAVSMGSTNTILHFALSSELAQKYFYTYTTRIIGQGPSSLTNYAFSIGINNTFIKSYAPQANGTLIRLPIDRSYIRSGENTINLMYNGPLTTPLGGGYLQFDFHRMEINLAPQGTLIRVR